METRSHHNIVYTMLYWDERRVLFRAHQPPGSMQQSVHQCTPAEWERGDIFGKDTT